MVDPIIEERVALLTARVEVEKLEIETVLPARVEKRNVLVAREDTDKVEV